MFSFPDINPIALSIGPFDFRWYGIMYLCGFVVAYFLGRYRTKKPWSPLTTVQFEDLLTWGIAGVVLGGRLGYVLFYDFAYYAAHPLSIFALQRGGMSFHGGLIGVIFAVWLYARRHNMPFFALIDFVAPLVPPGLFFGRIGNFINAELWGRVTTSPVGIVFPDAGIFPRHPSQLYEAALEGLVLFAVLWLWTCKSRPIRSTSGLFLLVYGTSRFVVEYVREPDAHLGTLALGLSMGQWLCVPMLLLGFVFFWQALTRQEKYGNSK